MKACSVSGMSVTKAYTVTQKSMATPPLPPPLVINPTPYSPPLTATFPLLPSPPLPSHPTPPLPFCYSHDYVKFCKSSVHFT